MNAVNKITSSILRTLQPCRDGYDYFCDRFPDGESLDNIIQALIHDGHDDWGYWIFSKCREAGWFPEITSKGYRNSGNWNSGNWNSGNWNRGNRNSGNRNSGNWNSGDLNSGNWNSGNWNSGFFNTDAPTTVRVFNRECDRAVWNRAYKPEFLFFALTHLVPASEMTADEKAADPECVNRGGQLRTLGYKEAFIQSWNSADPEDRERVRDLPNFDPDIFFEISGIDLR